MFECLRLARLACISMRALHCALHSARVRRQTLADAFAHRYLRSRTPGTRFGGSASRDRDDIAKRAYEYIQKACKRRLESNILVQSEFVQYNIGNAESNEKHSKNSSLALIMLSALRSSGAPPIHKWRWRTP